MAQDEIKIRSVPRSNETSRKTTQPRSTTQVSSGDDTRKTPRWIIYVGTVCVLAILTMLMLPSKRVATKSEMLSVQGTPTANFGTPITATEKHMQDSSLKEQMMLQKGEIESLQFRSAHPSLAHGDSQPEDLITLPDSPVGMGVQLDNDNSAEHVYDDLQETQVADNEGLPADRINSRLVNRKWVNEMERRERVQFISNFVRSAHDRGLEVEIDQNLVVVGVKKITSPQLLNINQVMDRFANRVQ